MLRFFYGVFLVGSLGFKSWGHRRLIVYPFCLGLEERKYVVGRFCLSGNYRLGNRRGGRWADLIRCVHVRILVQMPKHI